MPGGSAGRSGHSAAVLGAGSGCPAACGSARRANWQPVRYVMRAERLGSCESSALHPCSPSCSSCLEHSVSKGTSELSTSSPEVPKPDALRPRGGCLEAILAPPQHPFTRGGVCVCEHRQVPGVLRSGRRAERSQAARRGQARTRQGCAAWARQVINTQPGLCQASRAFRAGTLR